MMPHTFVDSGFLEARIGLWQYRNSAEVVNTLRSNGRIELEAQCQLIAMTAADPVLQRYPLRPVYIRRLLKALITACTDADIELSEALLVAYTQQLSHSENADSWGHRTYYYQPTKEALSSISEDILRCHVGALSATELLQQAKANSGWTDRGLVTLWVSDDMLAGGTGCHPWEAGFLLAEFILSNSRHFKGRSCLELGCGAGLVGVALHRATAGSGATIMLTDADSATLANCRHNLRLNGVPIRHLIGTRTHCNTADEDSDRSDSSNQESSSFRHEAASADDKTRPVGVVVEALDWVDGAPALAPQVVLGADLLYDPTAVPALVALLQQLLHASPAPPATSPNRMSKAICHTSLAGNALEDVSAMDSRPVAYLATKKRNEDTLELFLRQASEAGLQVEDISVLAHDAPVQFVNNVVVQDRSDVILHRIVCTNPSQPASPCGQHC